MDNYDLLGLRKGGFMGKCLVCSNGDHLIVECSSKEDVIDLMELHLLRVHNLNEKGTGK